ncbi:glycosyltransferase family 4 protein [Ectothiorhodospira haloalkaliphila]|uniref:glycosyltransferase family 4 protein n=1 Tax=Ectothiorhodospira haloalkaliphila TaxID=421628 RepID=UPI00130D6823|nr:glycosyltransferase family 1 protein [Ectothiorhodospira haloalkaliphila]
MVQHLLSYDARFFLYAHRPLHAERWITEPVTLRCACLRGRMAKAIWGQSWLPLQVRRDKVDVFWGPAHRLPPLLPDRMGKVVTIHDLVWKAAPDTMPRLNQLQERALMPPALQRADRVICVSRYTARHLLDCFPKTREKVRVIYPGASHWPPPDTFDSLAHLGIHQPYALFVGTLEPRKNIEQLLMAYCGLSQELRNHHQLVIAGADGWGGLSRASLSKRYPPSTGVVFTGRLPDSQLSTLYEHALFLTMPSLHEGFGLPVVEAMSFGKPVLISDRASLPEVAGHAGYMINPNDPSGLTRGLKRLFCDVDLRSRLSTQASARAQAFTWQTAADQLWNILRAEASAQAKS